MNVYEHPAESSLVGLHKVNSLSSSMSTYSLSKFLFKCFAMQLEAEMFYLAELLHSAQE